MDFFCLVVLRAARDAEALEREIAMLSERYGEAAAEAKNTGKTLLEKEALLDAVTAQVKREDALFRGRTARTSVFH